MRSIISAVLVLAALAAHSAYASDDPTAKIPNVQDLTTDTFDHFVNGAKHALVEFYAPWCGHCKRLVPEYQKLADLVANDPKLKNRVVIAKVNADEHRPVGDKFDVKGFPTIKFFPRGKVPSKENALDYNQARTATAFMEYIMKQLEADKGFSRVETLDPLAKRFQTADDKAAVVAETRTAVEALEGDAKANGEVYVKLMEKAQEKGTEYLAKEKARLEKMMASGSVAAAKMEEMARKASVLGAFVDEE